MFWLICWEKSESCEWDKFEFVVSGLGGMVKRFSVLGKKLELDDCDKWRFVDSSWLLVEDEECKGLIRKRCNSVV